MRILLAQINPIVGDFPGNEKKIVTALEEGRRKGAELLLFPELAVCGYPPEDLLLHPDFIDACEKTLQRIISHCNDLSAIIGLPRRFDRALHNSAAIIHNRQLFGYHDKILLPTYDVFDERRYFEPGGPIKVWELGGRRIAVTICEDIWHHAGLSVPVAYSRDPVDELKQMAPEVVVNLSASPFSVDKPNVRVAVCSAAARTVATPLVMCNQVGANDSLIFDGHSLHIDREGCLRYLASGFVESYELVDTEGNGGAPCSIVDPVEGLHDALVLGVRDYFAKQGFQRACIGLSGGIDSAVTAAIAVTALGKESVLGVSMPSRYSSEGSRRDAEKLAHNLGIECWSMSVESPFRAFLEVLQDPFDGKDPDATEENLQARVRGMFLMAISNKLGYIVLSTGNKSETAVGYSTLYGDMAGGLAVLSDVTKRYVYALARYVNRDEEIIPEETIEKPPSAELRPDQKDSDTLPPYDLVDTVVEEYVEKLSTPDEIAQRHGYDQESVSWVVNRIHRNEYKRRQMPPGLRVTEKAFSIGRRFPIVQRWQ